MKQCHFIGIGGIGMSGLAKILLSKKNVSISGSDLAETSVTKELEQQGAQVYCGHDSNYIQKGTTVIYSSGIQPDNPEFVEAKKYQCPLLHRSDLLKHLMSEQKTLAVAGTHGKTTTSALLTWVLIHCKYDPSYAVGGILPNTGSNGGCGKGEYFVAEADESDGTFTKYSPFGAIVTNVGLDHMEHYGSEDILMREFARFLDGVQDPDHLFWCGDDARLTELNRPGIRYGFGAHSTLRATNVRTSGWGQCYDITFDGEKYQDVEIALLGKHNVLNSLAVFGLALKLGVDEKLLREAFANFGGAKRRCEKKGELQEVLVLDDYAHHPTEIKTTLEGIREAIGERRLIAVFQPHRYSRTCDCLGTYGGIFDAADEILVTEIHAAGEKPIKGMTHHRVLEELPSHAEAIPRSLLVTELAKRVRPHDVVVTLGAGNVTAVGGDFVNYLRVHGVKKYCVGVVSGGRSLEHEISKASSQYIVQNLDPHLYDVVELSISKEGQWEKGGWDILKACDLLFPILHGPNGEDGALQGLLEMLDKPYVGSDQRASAVAMDKMLCKELALFHGISTSPFISFSEYAWKTTQEEILKKIDKMLTYPVFVKGVHLGSSLGVYCAEDEKALHAAVSKAFCVDTTLLVENSVSGRELEFAVSGNDALQVFPPAELLSGGSFCAYEKKYGTQAMPIQAPADLPHDKLEEGKALAQRIYRIVGCSGWARIDFFLDKDGCFHFNEVNPAPGCTPTSALPLILKGAGAHPQEFFSRLIVLGLQRHRHIGRKECIYHET